MTDRQAVDTTAAREAAVRRVTEAKLALFIIDDGQWLPEQLASLRLKMEAEVRREFQWWWPEVAAREAAADRLVKGLRKAVKDDSTEWVDANVIRLLLDRLARGAS